MPELLLVLVLDVQALLGGALQLLPIELLQLLHGVLVDGVDPGMAPMIASPLRKLFLSMTLLNPIFKGIDIEGPERAYYRTHDPLKPKLRGRCRR